ncbi:MAG: Crp/Fnr family transcriptional regulator [Vicinamibacterales bacterium]
MRDDTDAGDRRFRDHRDCLTLTSALFGQWPGAAKPGRVRAYKKGAFLWQETTVDHRLYYVRRGQVAILLNDAAGCELIVRVLDAGEPFGELCFCSERQRPRRNSARAIVDSLVLQIDFDEFQAYLRENAPAMEAFAFTLCERLSEAEKRIEVLSHAAADVRLGRLLLQLAGVRGVAAPGRPGRVRLAVGHEDLARMAAMSRPHVSVTMGKLRTVGVIEYQRGSQLTIDQRGLSDYLDGGRNTRPSAKRSER